MQRWGPRAKTTEVEACVALVCASTNDDRLLIDGTNLYRKWLTGLLQVVSPDA